MATDRRRLVREFVNLRRGRGSFSFITPSRVCKIKFHLMSNFGEAIRKFRDVSFLDKLVYKLFNVHIKKDYEGSFRSQQLLYRGKLSLRTEGKVVEDLQYIL